MQGSMLEYVLHDGESLLVRLRARTRDGETLAELRDLFDELRFKAHLSKLDSEGVLRADAMASGVIAIDAPSPALRSIIDGLVSVRASDFRSALKAFIGTPAHTPSLFAPLRRSCSDLLRTSRCLIHLRHAGVRALTTLVLNEVQHLASSVEPSVRAWAKRQRRDALELSCKAKFVEWSLWQPLLERKRCESRLKSEDLRTAESLYSAYEDTLRETSETNEEDARVIGRRCIVLRARALVPSRKLADKAASTFFSTLHQLD